MTEFELMEIFGNFSSVMHAWITTYFTTLTAYIIAAYIVTAAAIVMYAGILVALVFIWQVRHSKTT